MSRVIFIKNLGRMRYLEAWDIQKQLAQEVKANVLRNQDPAHKLLIVEHFQVYTIGIRSSNYTAEEEQRLKGLGAEFHKTNRGGLITFHGPGQLTLYPILHLKSFGKGIKWYISTLERAVIKSLLAFNILSHTTRHPGIWIGDKKICAIGVQGRHVTTHGLALNCNIDLSWFEQITPCGIKGKGVTSISQEVGSDVTIHQVLPHLLTSFSDVFEAELVDHDSVLTND